MKKFTVILIILFLASSLPIPAYSQTEELLENQSGINLRISPARLFLESTPGASSQGVVKIENQGTREEMIRIRIAKFEADSTGGSPKLTFLEEASVEDQRLADWLELSEETFTLQPTEVKTISFNFNPPLDAPPAHYFSLVFTRESDPVIEGTGAGITGGPALLVLNTVNSDKVNRKASIVEFKTDKKWYEFLPVTFSVKVENNGNVHLAPFGSIFVDSINKKEVGVLNINTATGYVLPNSSREFQDLWQDGFPRVVEKTENGASVLDDQGNRQFKVEWDPAQINHFRLGKYTANLLLVYDDGTRDVPIEATTTFWVVPWRIILTGLVLLLLVAIGMRQFIKKLYTLSLGLVKRK